MSGGGGQIQPNPVGYICIRFMGKAFCLTLKHEGCVPPRVFGAHAILGRRDTQLSAPQRSCHQLDPETDAPWRRRAKLAPGWRCTQVLRRPAERQEIAVQHEDDKGEQRARELGAPHMHMRIGLLRTFRSAARNRNQDRSAPADCPFRVESRLLMATHRVLL